MNEEKAAKQLGMNHSNAATILRKSIMFRLVQETGRDICYQCGKKIDNIKEFSIEHMQPWLDTENPVELFFDLDNIAFSHLICNIKNSRRTLKIITLICDGCNKAFEKTLHRHQANLRKGQTKFYCSKTCVHKTPSVDLAGEHSYDGPVVAVTE